MTLLTKMTSRPSEAEGTPNTIQTLNNRVVLGQRPGDPVDEAYKNDASHPVLRHGASIAIESNLTRYTYVHVGECLQSPIFVTSPTKWKHNLTKAKN